MRATGGIESRMCSRVGRRRAAGNEARELGHGQAGRYLQPDVRLCCFSGVAVEGVSPTHWTHATWKPAQGHSSLSKNVSLRRRVVIGDRWSLCGEQAGGRRRCSLHITLPISSVAFLEIDVPVDRVELDPMLSAAD